MGLRLHTEPKRRLSDGMNKYLPLLIVAIGISGCSAPNSAETDIGETASVALIEPIPMTEADEALYKERHDRYIESVQTSGRLVGYDDVEPVRGTSEFVPLPLVEGPAFDEQSVDQAIAYVTARRSSTFIVAIDGKIALERYFDEFDAQTPLVSKSMAKQLAALAIGRAITLGDISSLDQPASNFITEWGDDPQKSAITIRHLIENRSGLLPQDFSADAPEVLRRAYLHPRHGSVLVHEYPMTHEPGARFEYSNANSELLAIIIERATNRRYADFLGSELLRPIGATGGEIWINRSGGLAHSGCCIMMPAQSWVRLGFLVLQDGDWEGEQLISREFVRDMKTANPRNPHFGTGLYVAGPYVERRGYLNPSIELGKVLHSQPYLDGDLTLFDGNGNQVMYLIPSANMIVLRMGERPAEDMEWDNSVLPNLFIKAAVDAGKIAQPTAQRAAN